jgi:hypothetical protein
MPKQKQLPAVWSAHLQSKPKEQKEFEAYVRNSRGVFDRAIEIIDQYMESADVKVIDYDCPSWSHKQADINGFNRALKKIKTLFA